MCLPVPDGRTDTEGEDGGEDDPLAALQGDIDKLKGRTVLAETTASGWGEGAEAAPRLDWKPAPYRRRTWRAACRPT